MNTEIETLYNQRFSETDKARSRSIWKLLCDKYFSRFIRPQDVVLDLACGSGHFINNILCSRKIGVDINSSVRSSLDSDVEFFNFDAKSFNTSLFIKIDVVFTSNFFEHLKDHKELELVLDQVLSVLKPEGKLLVMGPNIRYLGGRYWDFYDHRLALTHLSLKEVLELKGFKVELCLDKFLPYTTKSRLPKHPFLIDLYIRHPWLWNFFGKQFFLVAYKPKCI